MLSVYEDPESLSGNVVKRFFCKTCGNPIKSETKAASDNGNVILKTGIFGHQVPKPEMEVFGKFDFLKPLSQHGRHSIRWRSYASPDVDWLDLLSFKVCFRLGQGPSPPRVLRKSLGVGSLPSVWLCLEVDALLSFRLNMNQRPGNLGEVLFSG